MVRACVISEVSIEFGRAEAQTPSALKSVFGSYHFFFFVSSQNIFFFAFYGRVFNTHYLVSGKCHVNRDHHRIGGVVCGSVQRIKQLRSKGRERQR